MTLADPPTERLSVRLRSGTRADHDAAQGSGFLDALAAGTLPRQAWLRSTGSSTRRWSRPPRRWRPIPSPGTSSFPS
jgi:hypothetical protein